MGLTDLRLEELKETWDAAGQGHVLAHAASLEADELAALVDQLQTLDPAAATAAYARATTTPSPAAPEAPPEAPLAPLPSVPLLAGHPERSAWRARGLEAVAAGEVAVLLLAGGQGSRLGFDGPKGTYDLGLPSRKSLFRLQGERLRKLEVLSGAAKPVPWYVMTSPATDEATRAYFAAQGYFGLREDQCFFFTQGVLPAFDQDGKILLEARSRVSVAPDGNGGVYGALAASGALADMGRRGVKYVSQYCVDNALVKVGDPEFVGFFASEGADCAAKVVRRVLAGEKVGVVALRGGRPSVVEYSEMDAADAARVDGDGCLVFRDAHVCVNCFHFDFLERAAADLVDELPLHVARKKIAHYDGTAVVDPPSPNGVKLERFIFDAFPFARKFSCLEGDRGADFAPVKNAPGQADSPDTARALVSRAHRGWLEAAGATVDGAGLVEVDARLSYDGEGLEGFRGVTVQAGLVEATPGGP